MRIIRLALGIYIITQGLQTGEWVIVSMGALFSLMPLLNIGCCGTAGCATPYRQTDAEQEEVTYTEVR